MTEHSKRIAGLVKKAFQGEKISITDTLTAEMLVGGLKRKGVCIGFLWIETEGDPFCAYGSEDELTQWACTLLRQHTDYAVYTLADIRVVESGEVSFPGIGVAFDIFHFDIHGQELSL